MSERIEIDDPTDPRLDDFRDLSTADRRPDRPGGRGLVIAEGAVVVRRLLASTYRPRALLGVPRRFDELESDLRTVDVPCYAVSAALMAQVVGFHLNRGVLATADKPAPIDAVELLAQSTAVVVLEGVGDHENLGSIFRNAAALGISAVLLGPGCADPLYRRSVRVSMGHVLAVPFAALPGTIRNGLTLVSAAGFTIAALTPRSTAIPVATADLPGHRVAVLLGSEGPGLTEEALAAADLLLRIPMSGGVDSVNVATAGAIAFAALRMGEKTVPGAVQPAPSQPTDE